MSRKLSSEQVDQYRDEGFVAPVDAFTGAQAAHYRTCLEALEKKLGGRITGDLMFKPHLYQTWIDEIVHSPEVLDTVEDVIGPDILLVQLTIWIKEAKADAFISWHQDATYFGLDPLEHVTAWVALSEASEESGCVEVLPGSHKRGQARHKVEYQPGNMLKTGQTIDISDYEGAPTLMPLRPGQLSLHHTQLLHNSRPNRSADRRIGLGISFIPAHVRSTSGVPLSATLVRGEDRYGYFQHDARPQVDCGELEMRRHAEAMARWNEGRKVITDRLLKTASG